MRTCTPAYIECVGNEVDWVFHFNREAAIRSFGVGLIALATVAAAGFLFRRRQHVVSGRRAGVIDSLYAAGL